MTNLNSYRCVSKPTVQSTTTIDRWLGKIKQSEYSSLIESARAGLINKSTLKEVLPCVTYNFLYDGYKKDTNIIQSTGLIYIDVDTPEFDISILDLNKIYSYYHSVGGEGYSILVKVEGVTKDNFKSTYQSIVNELGLNSFIDVNAVKHSQFNVLSFDPLIYINSESYIFNSVIIDTQKSTTSIVSKEKKDIYHRSSAFFNNDKKIKYNNNTDYNSHLNSNEYISDWENGYEQIKAWIPFTTKIKDGSRYSFLLSYGTNFLYINNHLDFYGIYNNLKQVNLIACKNPIDDSQLNKIAKTLMKQSDEKSLKPILFNKKRKIIFAENSTLNKEEKLKIVREEMAHYNVQKSKNRIYQIIENWDFAKLGKITQPAILKNNKIARATIQKYWSEFKSFVADENKNYKTENMKSLQKKNYLIEDNALMSPQISVTVESKSDNHTITLPEIVTPVVEPNELVKITPKKDSKYKYNSLKDQYYINTSTGDLLVLNGASILIEYFSLVEKDNTAFVKQMIESADLNCRTHLVKDFKNGYTLKFSVEKNVPNKCHYLSLININ